MYCFKCGASIPDTSASCPQCGAATAPEGGVTPPATVPAPPQQQNYPPAQAYAGPPQTDGKAMASLILGILSVLCGSFITGIPAVILGHMSKTNIKRSLGRLKGDGMATAGLI